MGGGSSPSPSPTIVSLESEPDFLRVDSSVGTPKVIDATRVVVPVATVEEEECKDGFEDGGLFGFEDKKERRQRSSSGASGIQNKIAPNSKRRSTKGKPIPLDQAPLSPSNSMTTLTPKTSTTPDKDLPPPPFQLSDDLTDVKGKGRLHSPSVSSTTSVSITQNDDGLPKETCQLLYAKPNVYVHPTSYLKDNVPGWLTIVKRGSRAEHTTESILLSWIPSSLLPPSSPELLAFENISITSSGSVQFSPQLDSSTFLTPPTSSDGPAFSLPLTQVYSIQVRSPTLTSWWASLNVYPVPGSPSQKLNGSGQKEIPTLFFHDSASSSIESFSANDSNTSTPTATSVPTTPGGVGVLRGVGKPPSPTTEFIAALRPHVKTLLRSKLDSTLYLVNPNKADVRVHSTPVWEDDAIDFIPGRSDSPSYLSHYGTGSGDGQIRGRRKGKSLSILHESLGQRRRVTTGDVADQFPDLDETSKEGSRSPSMGQLTFGVLSGFSKITKGARTAAQSAAQQVLSHPLAQPVLRHIPPPILAATHAKPEYSRWTETAGVGGFDSARVYLAKWARVVAEEGERARRAEVRVEEGDEAEEEEGVGSWEVLVSTYNLTPFHSTRASNQPISLSEYTRSLCDPTTSKLLLPGAEMRKRIFQRGLSPDDGVRKEVWPALLGVWDWEVDGRERERVDAEKRGEFEKLIAVWKGESEEAKGVRATQRFDEERHRIEIDCRRTDRTQPMFAAEDEEDEEGLYGTDGGDSDGKEYWSECTDAHSSSNFHVRKMQEILMTYNYYENDLGYVQGMSDLLSPIYVVVEGDQALAFWCFVGLMRRAKPNFLRDQSGMKRQLTLLQSLIALMDPQLYRFLERVGALNLFFVFRWMLCLFKREFEWGQVQRIWEVMWTNHYTKSFHIFFALAIIESQRDVIMRYLSEFDEILKYCNELAMTMDPEPLLARAEVLFLTFRSIVETYDKRKAEAEELSTTITSPSLTASGLRRRAGSAPEPVPTKEKEGKKKKLPPFDEALRELLD